MLSVAFTRPEKNHKAQVEAFAKLLQAYPQYRDDKTVKLVLLGGSRNAEDADRVEQLRSVAKELKVEVLTSRFEYWNGNLSGLLAICAFRRECKVL